MLQVNNNAVSTPILKLCGLIPSFQGILISALFNVWGKKIHPFYIEINVSTDQISGVGFPTRMTSNTGAIHIDNSSSSLSEKCKKFRFITCAKLSWCGRQAKIGKSEVVHWVSDRNTMNTSVLVSDPWCTHTACDTYCWLWWYSSWLEEMLSYSLLALQRVSSRICVISRIQSRLYHDLNLNQWSYGTTTCSL